MAWSIIGSGGNQVTAATSFPLSEPAGVTAGDLLVASISSRTTATTSITLPSGWTLVGEQRTNNVLTTTGAIASGMMCYIVRGASAPALTWTLPAGISVAIGRIIAYRGNAPASVLDVSAAATTATNTLNVNVAGLTTTQDDDLIVAAACGGQEATWSSFNATSPSGASGATDLTTAPSATWRERAEYADTLGADTSLGNFDAVKTAAGATGNLTVTASLGAGHVVIAGAFRIYTLASTGVWNAADKSATVTLSNGDKTATSTSALDVGIRSYVKHTNGTAGKYYAEFLMNTALRPDRIGITPTSNTLISATVNFWVRSSDGLIFVNGSSTKGVGAAVVANDVLCVAWDAGAEKVWFRLNGGNWNNTSGDNPATGTGGLDCSFAASTDHALWIQGNDIGGGATLRALLAEYTQTVPSGFTSWIGEALPTADAWSSSDKSANLTLSDSDRTATSTSATTAGIRSTQKYANETAGKYYAELHIVTKTGGINLGVQRTSTAVTTTTGAVVNYGTGTGALSVNSVTVATIATSTSGDVICFAWDAGAQRIWVRKNADLWNADAGADPATGTNGLDASALAAEDFALWGISTASGNVIALRTELADFTQTGPAGFSSWMGEPIVSALAGMKVWSGSAWAEKPVKVWSGSAWTQKPVKHWNGSAWV